MKKYVPFVAIAVVVIVGAAFFLSQNKSDSSTNSSNTTQQASSEKASSKEFNPVNTLREPFVSTMNTEGTQGSTAATIEYDGKENWRYTTKTSESLVEMIVTPSATYMKSNEAWFKLPTDSSTQLFKKDAYEVTDKELKDFQAAVTYKDEVSCPAGSCYLWVAENYQGNDKLEFYIDKSTNRINQLITTTKDGKITIVYTYKPVTITIPTNVTEVPGQQ